MTARPHGCVVSCAPRPAPAACRARLRPWPARLLGLAPPHLASLCCVCLGFAHPVGHGDNIAARAVALLVHPGGEREHLCCVATCTRQRRLGEVCQSTPSYAQTHSVADLSPARSGSTRVSLSHQHVRPHHGLCTCAKCK